MNQPELKEQLLQKIVGKDKERLLAKDIHTYNYSDMQLIHQQLFSPMDNSSIILTIQGIKTCLPRSAILNLLRYRSIIHDWNIVAACTSDDGSILMYVPKHFHQGLRDLHKSCLHEVGLKINEIKTIMTFGHLTSK